jgi:hypothetical protein
VSIEENKAVVRRFLPGMHAALLDLAVFAGGWARAELREFRVSLLRGHH